MIGPCVTVMDVHFLERTAGVPLQIMYTFDDGMFLVAVQLGTANLGGGSVTTGMVYMAPFGEVTIGGPSLSGMSTPHARIAGSMSLLHVAPGSPLSFTAAIGGEISGSYDLHITIVKLS